MIMKGNNTQERNTMKFFYSTLIIYQYKIRINLGGKKTKPTYWSVKVYNNPTPPSLLNPSLEANVNLKLNFKVFELNYSEE